VINKSRLVSVLGRVHDRFGVDTKQITAADARRLVAFLANVGDGLPHDLPDVLDDCLSLCDLFESE